MLTNDPKSRLSRLSLWVGVIGVGVGLVVGLFAGAKPLLPLLALVAVAAVVFFFGRFDQAVLGLLLVRSSIDSFTSLQLPSVFGVALNGLTVLYVTFMLLTRQKVQTDGFWWCLVGWWLLQGLWVILLPLGGLGLDGSYLSDSIREWIRLFSWLMVYLLVMQLKDRVPPEKVVSTLLWSLAIPITVALMQMFVPSLLPSDLSLGGGENAASGPASEGSRIRGTMGHPNGFATYLLLSLGLTWWKLGESKRRWPWLLLLGLVAFFYVGTKALFSLMMLAVFVMVLLAPRLSIPSLLGGVLLFGLVIALFGSTEFGQERLGSLGGTPLFNKDIDISRAILLSQGDNNSFNWRLSQWYLELNRWQQYPILGYGLGLSIPAAGNGFLPHNDYIRALVEGGMVGLVIFLTFIATQVMRLVWLIRNAPPGSKQRNLCLTLMAIFLALPTAMITENIWSHTMLFLYWHSLLAVAAWDWNEQPPLKQPARLPS
jgi:O-antigen ligase